MLTKVTILVLVCMCFVSEACEKTRGEQLKQYLIDSFEMVRDHVVYAAHAIHRDFRSFEPAPVEKSNSIFEQTRQYLHSLRKK